jgi:type IV pilus assembly protein PilB
VARRQDVPTINLDEFTIAREVLDLLPGDVALRHRVLPVNAEDGTLVLAMSDPSNHHAVDQVKRKTGMSVEVCLAETRALRRAIDRYYFPN